MIKKLEHTLGTQVNGGEPAFPNQGAIGRVGMSAAKNSIIEVGKMDPAGVWVKSQDSGHIALTPEERERLIEALESHREYRRIAVGDVVGGLVHATVMAVHYCGDEIDRFGGVVLAYSEHKKEYWVWTVDSYGGLGNGSYSYDLETALNRYTARLTEHLYSHYNRRSPVLTFAHVDKRDRLED